MLIARPVVLVLLVGLALSGCAMSGDERSASMTRQTMTAGNDALGLARERPGQIMVDQGSATVPTPYGGHGERRVCSTVARDIARLTAVLGADHEAPPVDRPEPENRSIWDSGRDLMTEAPEAAGDAAADAYHSAIVGLNPARPIVRFVGRAGEIEREARQQREMALKRRAYLRGLYDGFGCPRDQLIAMFDEYGLTRDSEE